MSPTSRTAILVLIGTLLCLFFGATLLYPGRPPAILPLQNCNAALWDHVYRPERLRVIEVCTAVEGRVVSLRRQSDGDLDLS